MENNLAGMYTGYVMAAEAVYTLGEFAEAMQEQLNEHSNADPRWNIRLIEARKAARILMKETRDLWNEWAIETGEIDA